MQEDRPEMRPWTPITLDELRTLVKARRRERGLNLRAAAAESGVSPTTLSRVERGLQLPGRDTLMRLLDWLGLAPRDAAPEPHPPGADTMAAIELHLRADQSLSRGDADAIAQMVRLAYERMRRSTR